MIYMIVATSKNNLIGVDNQLPWYIPEDLQYFKKITSGKTVVMGRKTFESIGRPLPNRKNIVLTRDKSYSKEGIDVVHHIQNILYKYDEDEELFIIGGGEIYKTFLPLATKLYITIVDKVIDGDIAFPEYEKDFIQISESPIHLCPTSHLLYKFTLWARK